MKHILIILSILLLSSPLFGQSEKPKAIIIPTGSLGDISKTRIKILDKTLESKLDDYFAIVPKEIFEEAKEEAFQELEDDECTEDQCVMKIQELLQVENAFKMELVSEEGDTQISLTWNDQNQKRVDENFCRSCGTFELREMIGGLVEKLVGVKEVEVVVNKPEIVVEEKGKGVLYERKVDGEWGWFEDGDVTNDEKYEGEIEKGLPNGQGTLTSPDGNIFLGEFKDGKMDGQGTLTFPDGEKWIGEFRDGKDWNTITYDKNGNILGRYVYGVKKTNKELRVKIKEKVLKKRLKKESETLYRVIVNGTWGWMKKGNSKINKKYIGETKNNLPEGIGISFQVNGEKAYSGQWLRGEKHGYGIDNQADNCIVKGEWKNGKYWNTTTNSGRLNSSHRKWCDVQYGYRNGIKGR
jgi:hypothetical protein